jgi:hypothetical protein
LAKKNSNQKSAVLGRLLASTMSDLGETLSNTVKKGDVPEVVRLVGVNADVNWQNVSGMGSMHFVSILSNVAKSSFYRQNPTSTHVAFYSLDEYSSFGTTPGLFSTSLRWRGWL